MARNNASGDNEALDSAARKRIEIGLSARRETANRTVARPPGAGEYPYSRALESKTSLVTVPTMTTALARPTYSPQHAGFGGWWLVLFTALIGVSTFLLVAARFMQSPTDLRTVDREVSSLTDGRISIDGAQGALTSLMRGAPNQPYQGCLVRAVPTISEEFESLSPILADAQDGIRAQRILPARGLYSMTVKGGNAAWSLLGSHELCNYRLQTSLLLPESSTEAAVGLISRFRDVNHFVLFLIDEKQRFQVVRVEGEGRWSALLPWTTHEAIAPVGEPNHLMIEDTGTNILFSVNTRPLFDVTIPAEEYTLSGDAGLWLSAIGKQPSAAEFEFIKLEPLPR